MAEERAPRERRPYSDVRPSEMILRDHLAVDRTVLANERTLLAYARTALTLFLVGISFIHLPGLDPNPAFGKWTYPVAGWTFVAAAGAFAIVGLIRYRRFKREIRGIARQVEESESPPP
jgi:putative membrane protein